jgi:hypothetical protein
MLALTANEILRKVKLVVGDQNVRIESIIIRILIDSNPSTDRSSPSCSSRFGKISKRRSFLKLASTQR